MSQPLLFRESSACIVQGQLKEFLILKPHIADKGHKLTFVSLRTGRWLRQFKTSDFAEVWTEQGPGSENFMARRRREECFLPTGSSFHRKEIRRNCLHMPISPSSLTSDKRAERPEVILLVEFLPHERKYQEEENAFLPRDLKQKILNISFVIFCWQ